METTEKSKKPSRKHRKSKSKKSKSKSEALESKSRTLESKSRTLEKSSSLEKIEELKPYESFIDFKKVQEYGNTPLMKKDPYVRINYWDAEKGVHSTKTITKNRYKTVEELEQAIKDIRAAQREKNRQYKEDIALGKIVKKPTQAMLDKAEESLLVLKPLQERAKIKKDIKLALAPNTGNSTVIFGSSKRGKSTLLMYLYRKYYRGTDFISTLYAGNSQISLYDKKHNKDLILSNGFGKDQEKYIKLQKFINTKTKNAYKFLNMFDDMVDLKNKKLLTELVLSYRNSNISTIILLQYVYLLSKMNRANVNNVIIFGCNNNESAEEMIKAYLRPYFNLLGVKGLPDQIKYFNHITSDYGFIYINNLKNTITFHRLDSEKIS